MRSEAILRRVMECSSPTNRNPLTVREVATTILPEVRSLMPTLGTEEVSFFDVAGAYTVFMYNQGQQIGNVDLNLQTWNAFGMEAGEKGFTASELSDLVDIAVNGSFIGLIRALPVEEREQLPRALYDLVRLEKYEHCGSI